MRLIIFFLLISTACFSQSRAKKITGYWKIGKLAIDTPSTAPSMKALRYNTSTGEVTVYDTSGSVSLTSTYIAYGSGTNAITGTSDLIRNSAGEVILNSTDQGAYKLQVAGNMYLGNSTQSVTATPEILNMGGTIGNALAGSKLWLFNDGFNKAGIGFNSSGTQEVSFNTSSASYYYRWYGNGTQAFEIQPSSKRVFIGDGSTGSIGSPYFLSFGNTYSASDVAGLKIKLQTDNAGSDYGFGTTASGTKLIYVVPGTNTAHAFYNNAVKKLSISNTAINITDKLFVGDSSTTASSTLQVGGSFSKKYTSTATGITLDATHCVVEVTATGQTITLPTAASITGRVYTIKLTASGSGTVATTSSQTIDGSTTYSLASQYKYVTVQSNGSNWIVIANN